MKIVCFIPHAEVELTKTYIGQFMRQLMHLVTL